MTRAPIGLGLLAGLGCGCVLEPFEPVCTDAGCGFVATFDVISTPDLAILTGANLEVCIGSGCVTVAVPMVIPNIDNTASAHGDFTLRCDSYQVDAMRYDVEAFIEQTHEIAGLGAGDVYTMSLTASDGTLLVGKSWLATTYTESDPNGADCGPHCVYAHLTPAM